MKFTHSITSVLTTPRFRHNVHHASGDATLDKYTSVLWNPAGPKEKGQLVVGDCKEYHQTLLDIHKVKKKKKKKKKKKGHW